MAKSHLGHSIEPCDPFPNLEPPKELPSTIKTEQLEVLGISKVTLYNICPTCTKNVVINSQKNIVKCQTCGITVHKSKCELHPYGKVVFKKENIKLNFTLFHQNISQVVEIYNATKNSNEPVNVHLLSEEELEELILSFDSLMVAQQGSSSNGMKTILQHRVKQIKCISKSPINQNTSLLFFYSYCVVLSYTSSMRQ